LFLPEVFLVEPAPDPSNSQPDAWLGEEVDDTEALAKLANLTQAQLDQGADLDRVEGLG
jgi:hypothetical protein